MELCCFALVAYAFDAPLTLQRYDGGVSCAARRLFSDAARVTRFRSPPLATGGSTSTKGEAIMAKEQGLILEDVRRQMALDLHVYDLDGTKVGTIVQYDTAAGWSGRGGRQGEDRDGHATATREE